MKDFTLVALVKSLATGDTKADDVHDLQTELYNRLGAKFYDRVHKIMIKTWGGLPDIDTLKDDIFKDTWIVAMDKIVKFKVDEKWNDDECEKVILFWFGKIANNLLLKLYNTEKKEKEELVGYKHFLESENSKGAIAQRRYKPTYDRVKIQKVMTKLNPMAKEVLFASLKHGTLKEENKNHMPDAVLKQLTDKYKVTPSALRKAKERAIKAIITCKIKN
ncbi:MAG: sigma-70 family RNA polymerase sigma factor [Bacteroidetes bacterium]|nr:sigma-70 family RNA polymerase sigma factor [Bacteroidota bacterium]